MRMKTPRRTPRNTRGPVVDKNTHEGTRRIEVRKYMRLPSGEVTYGVVVTTTNLANARRKQEEELDYLDKDDEVWYVMRCGKEEVRLGEHFSWEVPPGEEEKA